MPQPRHPQLTPDPAVATLSYRRQLFTVPPGTPLDEAIIRCGFSPEAMIAVKNGHLISDDVVLQAGDVVKLLPTISGG